MDGFAFYTETSYDAAAARTPELVLKRAARYETLLERRRERGLTEPYAWFRPFNESSRALDPFETLLHETVTPGVPIIDLWCRTGWTGELLASWFPDNEVVSLWEGDKDVLGYPGFLRWLPQQERVKNLQIIFADPAKPLPFPDGHFGLVHGLDTLHRYPHDALLEECLRVARRDAPLVFPHVHLTNNEPDPFFERGCTQLHGQEWGAVLERATRLDDRRALVLSERDLYQNTGEVALVDDRGTAHYNGFIALAPPSWEGRSIGRSRAGPRPTDQLFVNPLLTLDTTLGKVRIDRGALGASVGHMCDRHPPAVEALGEVTDRAISSLESQILVHASGVTTVEQVAAALDQPVTGIAAACAGLIEDRAMCAENISPAMAHLQHHYQTGRPEKSNTFADLWATLHARYETRNVLLAADGSAFNVQDLTTIVDAVRSWFKENAFTKGDTIAICAQNRAESLLIAWASWLEGLVVFPLRPEPKWGTAPPLDIDVDAVFCDRQGYPQSEALASGSGVPCILLDATQDFGREPVLGFEDLVVAHLGENLETPNPVSGDGLAVLMPTSGSTGQSKIVELSMASLLHSGLTFINSTDLNSRDRLLSLGPMHTMSGLRNPAIAALLSGATIVIDETAGSGVLAAVEACARQRATVLCAGPSFVTTLATAVERIDPASLDSVRLLTTTADRVDPAASSLVASRYGFATLDYYGLTETGGIVVAGDRSAQGSLGWAVGAAVEVHVEGRRADPGEVGEIRVSGPSLMTGYQQGPRSDGVKLKNGWAYTGDLGVVCADGSIDFVGRLDEQLKHRSGEIFPNQAALALVRALEGVVSASIDVDPSTGRILLDVRAQSGSDVSEESVVRALIRRFGSVGVPDVSRVEIGEAGEAS